MLLNVYGSYLNAFQVELNAEEISLLESICGNTLVVEEAYNE